MHARRQILMAACSVLVLSGVAPAWASVGADLPAVEHSGPVTYLTGGSEPGQQQAMQRDASRYPLELQFLWGRGAKETPVTASAWSIRDASGHVLASGSSGGPVILASLPDGRYTVHATYDGDALTRVVRVRKGNSDDVLLEWPQ